MSATDSIRSASKNQKPDVAMARFWYEAGEHLVERKRLDVSSNSRTPRHMRVREFIRGVPVQHHRAEDEADANDLISTPCRVGSPVV